METKVFSDKVTAYLKERISFAAVMTKNIVYDKLTELLPFCDITINEQLEDTAYANDDVIISFGSETLRFTFTWVKKEANEEIKTDYFWLMKIE